MKNKARLTPLYLLTFLSFIVVIKSLDKSLLATGLALAGFAGFLTMSIIFSLRIGRQNSGNSTKLNQ